MSDMPDEIREMLLATFTETGCHIWWVTSNAHLNGASPAQFWHAGDENRVREVVERLESGHV